MTEVWTDIRPGRPSLGLVSLRWHVVCRRCGRLAVFDLPQYDAERPWWVKVAA